MKLASGLLKVSVEKRAYKRQYSFFNPPKKAQSHLSTERQAKAMAAEPPPRYLLGGAVWEVLKHETWWLSWRKSRDAWLRDAGSWLVTHQMQDALLYRPNMMETMLASASPDMRTWLSNLSFMVPDDTKLAIQTKILHSLATASLDTAVRTSDPFHALGLYFMAQCMREASKAMVEDSGTAAPISWPFHVRYLFDVGQRTAAQRCTAFLSALRNGNGTDLCSLVQSLLPSEQSESTIEAITVLAQTVLDQLAFTRSYVDDYVATLLYRMTDVVGELKRVQYDPFPTLLYADNALSRHERARLCAQFARLEREVIATATTTADTDAALIDPFMYANISDETRVMDEQDAAGLDCRASRDPQERMLDGIFMPLKRAIAPVYFCGYFMQTDWIPSDFYVDPQGRVSIQSYINNLHPMHHRRLYGSIGRLFEAMLPLFEQILNQRPFKLRSPIKSELQPGPEKGGRISLRGRHVQVVVAALNMRLVPGTPRHERGDWHTIGQRIAASGLYCYSESNTTAHHLSVLSPERSIAVPVHRAVVFGRALGHRLEPFELSDRRQPGFRKFVALHLVEPEHRKLSGRRIPPQQFDWAVELLDRVWTARGLPESVAFVLRSFIWARDEKWTPQMELTKRQRRCL